MSDINTNLSVSPYWDDYDASKQYYKILFVPSRAVQVREINQIQTIIKHQISRFADHVFKDGSIVSGCNITYTPRLKYVRLKQFVNFASNNAMSTSELSEFLVVSPTTGLRASIQLVEQGFTNDYPNTNMFYVNYLNKGRDSGDNEVTEFSPQETLSIYDRGQDKHGALNPGLLYNTIETISQDTNNNILTTGEAYAVTVGDGIVYQKGYFVNVIPHTILVNKHDTETRGKLVGFETRESIISYLQDQTLIDPVDTSNRNGRGADRLKLSPELVVKDREDISTNDDFFPIIEFGKEDLPVKQNTDPEYTQLGDYIAKQKYETNGDFYIKPFIISTKESANTSNFNYTLDAGIAYIKGNRVHLLNTLILDAPRATDIGFTNNNITTLNYGNYININEVQGTFNGDKLVTAQIYNTAQTAVTAGRTPGAAIGAAIGTANIRAVLFDSGDKGAPLAMYRLYLTNISMNSGYSFVNDAKSFVISQSDNQLDRGALADIVLVSGKATLVDSSASGLLFPTGIVGTRRYRDNNGVNDTTFTFRDISTATLQANGSVTFTLNTPYAGGSERFFASPGSLTSANKQRIDITPASPIITADLPGTVNGNTANTSIIGLGTQFTDHFIAGETIRIGSNNYRIASIANNTLMTSVSNVTGGGSTDNYAKVYPAYGNINLDRSDVTAVSNTQFVVSLGASIVSGAPQTLTASYPVVRGEAYEIKKEVRRGTNVRIDCTTNTNGPFNLGLVDIFNIESIFVGATYSENNPDRKNWFMLDSGQQSTHYEHGRLILKPEHQGKLTTSSRILVKVNHFVANTVAGIGFYTVDSYPVRAPGEVANTTNISYDDIPDVDGRSLRGVVDFRPQKYNTATITTDANTATINPPVSNTSFNINLAGGSYLGEPDTNFTADIEYYLPRYDLIQVNKDGIFSVKGSIPAEKPTIPFTDNDSMAIGTAYVPPYPGITADISLNYNASKPRVKTNLTGIRGYTMRDINALDKRISILEYYQALSMLEQSAKDYSVKDENGLDRFKNGIFANPFKNHLLSDVSNFEYSIAIDEDNQLARPRFIKNNIDLDVNNNLTSNIKVSGRTATLDYTSEIMIDQPYATKFRNVVDSVWYWSGHLQLFPEYDHFQDESILPEVNIDIDLASPWEEFANSPFGSDFGEWRVTSSSSTHRDRTTQTGNSVSGGERITTRTTTTTTTSARDQYNLEIETSQTSYDLGSYVVDVALNPYMRSRQIAFVATGLIPNARFWAYFADEPVSEFCAPGKLDPTLYNQVTGELTIDSGKENAVVIRTDNLGTPLMTDSFGNLYGIFNIPAGRFRVGDRQLVIADVDDIILGRDAILSSAIATYTASALTTSTRSIGITTTEPTLTTRVASESKVEVGTSSRIISRVAIPGQAASQTMAGAGESGSGPSSGDGPDPLGQSFYIESSQRSPGVFLESIDVFFRAKDENLGITCYITEMIAGVPDASRVLASAYLKPSAVNISNDSSLSTKFKFKDIPYLERDKYYTFFIQPDANSPEYTVWTSDIGNIDILTGIKIFSNPYMGVMFKSANSNTWDAIQTEDIKFKANICSFVNNGSLTFNEQEDEYLTVEGFALANVHTHIQVGDHVYTAANNVPIVGVGAPHGIVQEVNTADDTLILDSSTGGFTSNTLIHIYRPTDPEDVGTINPNTLIASALVQSIDDVEYSLVVPKISSTTPAETRVAYYFKGTDTSNILDANWYNIMEETELELIDKVRVVRSKSNRVSPSTKTTQMRLDLTSNNRYLSPIVNLRRRSLYAIDNIINNDLTDEHTRQGNALARYISPIITLKEGQDAEDIEILATAYRPSETDIHCYVKLLCGDDGDQFYDKFWTKLVMSEGAAVRSSSTNVEDYREFRFSFPTEEEMQGTAYLNDNNLGIVEYRNTTGTLFVGYKSFAVKFILTSTQKQRVPRLIDFRGMALQK